ncbi:hypothetical protein [Agrococcus sp. KRD186]|uniref:hypothetical protein n=1 Tax=Agrococcus sp. KRD186 TaxID=2729730 RepID=UPI001F49F265|nr:hypothetical protein [Agrococcus sp. KRD186]
MTHTQRRRASLSRLDSPHDWPPIVPRSATQGTPRDLVDPTINAVDQGHCLRGGVAERAQLYSRIGFAHEYRPVRSNELAAVITQRLPLPDPEDDGLAHTAAVAAITRVTSGNFRLADRLITQITRILDINQRAHLTPEAVDAAQEALRIGR